MNQYHKNTRLERMVEGIPSPVRAVSRPPVHEQHGVPVNRGKVFF
jgi:hypothetical protein